MTTQKNKCR